MLPRMMLKNANVAGMDCLDIGTMEGLIPVLMAKRGAKVIATDYSRHCASKMEALSNAHGVDFYFQTLQTAYDAHLLVDDGFDLINLSGLLYHVVSPLMVLLGVRPLLKRNGLLIVSTNVIMEPGMYAEFNARGRMQIEANTFWYPTIELLEYWLRMLKLQPIDCVFLPHASIGKVVLGDLQSTYVFDKRSGYLSVVCRAVDEQPQADGWMASALAHSVEFERLTDWKRASSQPLSSIEYDTTNAHSITAPRIVTVAKDHHESHLLMLEDAY